MACRFSFQNSQHLKMLTLYGVIERRREHQRIFYTLKDKRIGKLVRFLESEFLAKAAK